MIKILGLFLLVIQGVAIGGVVNIGVFYPHQGHLSSANCITKEVLKNLDKDKYHVKYYNIENTIPSTLSAVSNAIDDGLDIAIGTITSQQAMTVAKELKDHKIPFIIPMASHPSLTENNLLTIRIVPNAQDISKLMSRFVSSRLNVKKIAILSNISSPYSKYYSNEFQKNLKSSKNMEIKQWDYISGEIKFQKTINEIKQYSPDLVYLPLYSADFIHALQLLVNDNINTVVLSQGGIADGKSTYKDMLLKNPNIKIIFNNMWSGNPDGKFKDIFLNIMNNECKKFKIEARNANAFDAAMLLKENINKYQGDGKKFIELIKRTIFPGITGKLKFNSFGDPEKKINLLEIQKGKYSKVMI